MLLTILINFHIEILKNIELRVLALKNKNIVHGTLIELILDNFSKYNFIGYKQFHHLHFFIHQKVFLFLI